MDFALMSCPYCGRAVDSSNPRVYVCRECGKFIFTDRADEIAFIHPGDVGDSCIEAMQAVADDNTKKAMAIANDLVENTECVHHNAYFLRGYIYTREGEDGKALADWKKGLEMLGNNVDLDAYVCLMSKSIADMVAYKEREFIEFNVLSYVDKLCEEIRTCTGLSCKAFIYYSIYRDCVDLLEGQEDDEEVGMKDIIPELMRRVVAYHRNYWCLPRIIDEFLELAEYNPETFEEDDKEVAHTYDLIRIGLEEHISQMTDEDRLRIFDHWNDEMLEEEIEPLLDAMVKPRRILSKILAKDEPEVSDIDTMVREYVDRCLLIPAPREETSEEDGGAAEPASDDGES